MKKLFKIILWVIFIPILLFALFLVWISIMDYKPEAEVDLLSDNPQQLSAPITDSTFNMVSWNLGYAGLGKEMDFFYDGGLSTNCSPELSSKYLYGIKSKMREIDSVDFWLFQEIDEGSKRSYYTNQLESIKEILPEYQHVFALNYVVPFVPMPVNDPMGRVRAGMMTSAPYGASEATRVAYPLIASWPNKLFFLDRCMILTRHPLSNGKDLVILNTHNTAYINDAALRSQELDVIRKHALKEFDKGNYVVVGGDWNMNPPAFVPDGAYNGHRYIPSKIEIEADYFPDGWQWAYGTNAPTNRENNQAYVKGENGTRCLDFFLVSPNVELLNAKTIDLEFEMSDHNPIFVKLKLK